MNSIKENLKKEYIIKNSKFIVYLYRINSLEDIDMLLKEVKENHVDATHYPYAYILDNLEHCNDDGEPAKTAGMPLLNILKQNNLNHILCINVRYFGGIKLGANGLIRAYAGTCKSLLNDANIITLKEGYIIKISFSYNDVKKIDYLLKNMKIMDKDFKENIIYTFELGKDELDILKSNNIKYEIIKDILIEK